MEFKSFTYCVFFQLILLGQTHGVTDCWARSCEYLEALQVGLSELSSTQVQQSVCLTDIVSKTTEIENALEPGADLNIRMTEMSSSLVSIGDDITNVGKTNNRMQRKLNQVEEKVVSEVQIIQQQLTTNVSSVARDVNSQVVTSEESIRNDLLTCETNILSSVQNSQSILDALIIAAISTSETNVKNAITASENSITSAVEASEANIVADTNSAIAASESNLQSAIGSSETNVVSALTTSESNIVSAVGTSKGNIVSAVGTSETNVIDSVNASEIVITAAVGTSENNVISTLVETENNVTSAIDASESSIISAVGTSEGNIIDSVNASVVASEANILALINSKCGQTSASAYVDNSDIQEILIELDIFAGLTNPSWTVTNETAEFETLKVALTGAKSSTIPLLAGYRGFIVTTTFTDGTIVYRTYGQGGQSSTTLEMALLNSNDGTISSDVIDIAAAGINGLAPPDIGTINPLSPVSIGSDSCGKVNPCVEPEYNISVWSSALDNSYNYAVNIETGTYAQPGRGAGSTFLDLTGMAVRSAAVLDGLKDHEDESAGSFPVDNNCLLVLTLVPGVDFHFYRRDDDGNWSHKLGQHPPTNLDNSGNVITDPRTADIGPYKYVRFLSVCPRKVQID